MSTAMLICREAGDAARIEAAGAAVIDDLCARPDQLGAHTADADHLVLVLHRDRYALADVQTQCRAAGFDPLGVPILDHDDTAAADSPDVVLAAAAARAVAFRGSTPEESKPVFPQRMTRRSLFGFPRPEYVAVPSVDHETCAASDGCAACVAVCPTQAYRIVGGRVVYDKAACEPCGVCVTTCPTAAIHNPAVTPEQIMAQVEAIVAEAPSPPGIAYVCRRRSVGISASGWYAVEVPCTGMATATWLLAPLLLGASSTSALPCAGTGCPLGLDALSGRAVRFARELLATLGLDGSLVRASLDEEPASHALPAAGLQDPFGVHGGPETILALAAAGSGPSFGAIVDDGSPVGTIDIDEAACTLCMSCASICPTGALGRHEEDGRLALTFDATLCTACGQCVPGCPELRRGAIRLRKRVDSKALGAGRRTLYATETLRCESCGGPIAPTATMDRIGVMLGDEYEATLAYLKRFCMDCRGV